MKDFLDQYLNNCSKHYAAHIQQDIVPITSKALIGKATETVFHQLQQLPELDNKQFTITNGHIQLLNGHVFNEQETQTLSTQLKAFRPWRKGPFSLGNITIDSEWRCNMKWQRIKHDFNNKRVLDVGCGNGYFLWQLLNAGAKAVVGIDPYPLYFFQQLSLQRFCKPDNLLFLPTGYQAFEHTKECFDTILSMGVLYHQKNIFEHLSSLKRLLKPKGSLILETLIIESNQQISLCPTRYANMKNVYFIPSLPTLTFWLEKTGFIAIDVQDISPTTTEEQRSSEWSNDMSLVDALDKENQALTIEGHPAPLRCVIVAQKK